jgi:hypothetical protein
MAAQDFGSGLLAGFQGASAMAQQRRDEAARDRQLTQRDAALAQRKTEFDESVKQFEKTYEISAAQEAREQSLFDMGMTQQAANNTIAEAANIGLFNPASGNFSLSTDRLTELLGSKNQTASKLLIDAANRQNPIEGFKFTDYQRAEDGSIVVTGEYEDGSPGVLTEDGSSDPTSRVATFTPAQAASLVSDDFINVTNASSILSGQRGVAFLAFSGANSADIAQAERVRTLQANVLPAIDSSGDVGLSRQFRSVLADAGSSEEKIAILEDQATSLGIELPKIQAEGELVEYEPFSAELDSDVLSKPAEDASLKSRNRMLRRIPLLDKEINEARTKFDAATSEEEKDEIMLKLDNLSRRRKDIIDTQNNVSLEAVSAEIKDLKAKQNKAYLPELKERYQSQIDERMPVKTQLEEALGLRTQVMGTQEYKSLEEQVFTRLDAMTPEQVDEAVDNGDLTFTPEQIGVMRQRLQESNITSVQQISELPSNEQLAYRALLAVIAPDQTARDQARAEMSNLKETGTLSLSAQEAGEQGINQTNALTNLRNSISRQRELERNLNNDQRARVDKAAEEATKFGEETVDTFFGEESDGLTARSARKYTTTILPRIMTRASSAALPEEQQIYQAAINQGVSLAVAGYAAEEEGGFSETLYSFFRIDAEDVVSSTDFDLSRVGVDMRGGRPATFYYTGPDGRIADQRIRATALRNLDDNLYNIVAEAAQKNVEAARSRR